MKVRTKAPFAIALTGALALAACGSSSSGGGGTTTSSGAKLSGDPVKIVLIAPQSGPSDTYPQFPAAVKAAATAVNKAGGIQGRPLEVTVCDDQFDPNKGADCANKAVEDKALFVTSNSSTGDRFMPILEKAKIPVIGNTPNSATELKSPYSYPFGTGAISIAGGGTACGKLDKKEPAVAVVDIAAGRSSAAFFGVGLKPFNLEIKKTVPVPPTATDLSTYAASLTGATDCVEMVLGSGQASKMVQALSQAGSKATPIYGAIATDQEWINKLGTAANGLVLVGALPPTNDNTIPAIKQYNAELDAAGVSPTGRNEGSLNMWATVHLVAQYAQKLPKLDGESLANALNTAGEINFSPLPKVDFAKPIQVLFPGNRIFTTDVYLSEIKNGTRTPLFDNKVFNVLNNS
ncbi:ABC transporter substrate-binding protein [Frankia sp. Cppng1_Ct_nod]|uniref:ABC transporter substrate-binding protein n=1 Tax=Frankia sp. Cppng1_Ct_nod TaxID=2897162 RepID=UPI0010413730|nr:ABC transporter substrate-binding protein [Frankia sp. Cppng1_Ct_nod]